MVERTEQRRAGGRATGGRVNSGRATGGLNVAVVCGVLARPAEHRLLPSGGQVVAYEVTVARGGERSETVPVVWLDPPASAADRAAGERVVVVGRVRRRFFRAGGSTQSRTEVVADVIVGAGQVEGARQALAKAQAALVEAQP